MLVYLLHLRHKMKIHSITSFQVFVLTKYRPKKLIVKVEKNFFVYYYHFYLVYKDKEDNIYEEQSLVNKMDNLTSKVESKG